MYRSPTFTFIGARTIIVAIICWASLYSPANAARSTFMMPVNTGCACPGDMLTYTCTVVGAGSTQWSGSLFDCPANGIVLRHNIFDSTNGAIGECNEGAVLAQSAGVENDCYTSQLSFTVTTEFDNKTVLCTHNSISGNIVIGTSLLAIVEGPPPPPESVILTSAHQRTLTFSWRSSIQNCTSISYAITSTNCGSCPPTTNATSVTCNDVQLSRDESNCTFRVHSIVCAIMSRASNPIVVAFKVPDVPRVMFVPVYSFDSHTVVKAMATVNQANRSNIEIVDSYNIYVNSDLVASNPSCVDNECTYSVNIPQAYCPRPSSDISVTISAVNGLGEGPTAEPTIVECNNRFVDIKYNSATSTITCTFLNSSDNSEKICSVEYGHSNKRMTIASNSTSNTVTLELSLDPSNGNYWFVVTASNDTHTVMVEGNIVDSPHSLVPIVVSIFIVLTVLLLLVIGVAIIIRYIRLRAHKRRSYYEGFHNVELDEVKTFTNSDLKPCIVESKPCDQSQMILVQYEVEHNCSLKEFVEGIGLTFKRGCAFYEFVNSVECITEDKVLIFAKKSGKRFMVTMGEDFKDMFGESVKKPNLKDYVVFVQSTGSGKRHVQSGSKVLYNLRCNMWPVDRDQYEMMEVDSDCSLEEYGKKHQLEFESHSFYLESSSFNTENSDMIIENKTTRVLLRGPHVQVLVTQCHGDFDMKQWRVFAQGEYDQSLQLSYKKWILYQKENTLSTDLDVVTNHFDINENEEVNFDTLSQTNGLLPIHSNNIYLKKVKKGTKNSELYKELQLKKSEVDLFLKLDDVEEVLEDLNVRDVFLMGGDCSDEHNDGIVSYEIFTGPFARHLVQDIDKVNECLADNKYQVYVLISDELDDSFEFPTNTTVCHQKCRGPMQEFKLLTVDEDNVRMSDFITRNMEHRFFENGKAFYEFNECEDFLYFKEVVLLKATGWNRPKEEDRRFPKRGILKGEFESLYKMSTSTPGVGIQPLQATGETRFIQSLSQGSRCLKKGDVILYKI